MGEQGHCMKGVWWSVPRKTRFEAQSKQTATTQFKNKNVEGNVLRSRLDTLVTKPAANFRVHVQQTLNKFAYTPLIICRVMELLD